MTAQRRIVLAEDNYLVREGTRLLLEDTGQVRVVGVAGDADELLEVVARVEPDVVLTDIRMPPNHHVEGIEAALRIRAEHPQIGVVVLSQYVDGRYALKLFEDGVEGLGYLLKERVGDLDELLSALHAVATKQSAIDARVVEALVATREQEERSPLRSLSQRELEVLQEMARGKNNAGVARALFVSESAVEKHVSQIFMKLGITDQPQVSRRVAAVLAFLSSGRVAPVRD
jgi:DNA-binding NarL/FixJ family response regulator